MKNLAAKNVEFKVQLNSVHEIQLPELNDEFAKGLGGYKNLSELKETMKKNLISEEQQKERSRLEEEIVNQLIQSSKISDIPDLLLNSEAKRMVDELEQNVAQQGIKFEDYLTHLKKTRADLLLDFSPQAIKRIKGALVTREIAKSQNFEATPDNIIEETQKILSSYQNNPEIKKRVQETEFVEHMKNILISRKTMDYLIKNLAQE